VFFTEIGKNLKKIEVFLSLHMTAVLFLLWKSACWIS